MKKNTTSGISTGKIVAVSAGVAALAAASYYFFGPEGQKHRKMAKGWMLKMKAEVIEKMERAKDMTQTTYDSIVDTVAKKYAKNTEVATMAALLKKQWKGISGSTKKPAKKTVKKSAK